ncbi:MULTISPECIES: metallophosphoesterase [unclassified Mycobacterium]|uniref:P-loop NTPase n=1 Tax=unclassified Mycobacterium TaxID=2642494 RepID=UPI0029C764D9|nr:MULTISPECIES: metallophosphoesterase [unclassified Mycobacterium]
MFNSERQTVRNLRRRALQYLLFTGSKSPNVGPYYQSGGNHLTRFNILHITDIHFGQWAMKGTWPSIEQSFLKDLEYVCQQAGTIDLIALTGDIANRGAREDYDKAFDFVENVALSIDMVTGSTPQLAAVPGNHDIDRSLIAPLTRNALETSWTEFENDFLGQDNYECRQTIVRSLSEFSDWIDRGPCEMVPTDSTGILPGDFTARITKDGATLGILGLNSTYRHLSDRASEHSLTVSARQIQEAAQGNLPLWGKKCDVAVVLTHHPQTWLSNPAEFREAIFYDGSPIRLHLCGHLHRENRGTNALASVAENYFLQGESLFGTESVPSGTERLHGYSVLSIEVGAEEASFELYPRAAALNSGGSWTFDRSRNFGVPRGSDKSKPTKLDGLKTAPTQKRSPTGTNQATSAGEPSQDAIKADLQQNLAHGLGTLILSDLALTEKGTSPQDHLRSEFASIASLDADIEHSAPLQDLYDLSSSIDNTRSREVLEQYGAALNEDQAVTTNALLSAPWLRVIVSAVVDPTVGQYRPTSLDDYTCQDTRSLRFQLPSATQPTLMQGFKPIAILSPEQRSGEIGPADETEWLRYIEQTIIRTPTVFVSDGEPDDRFWSFIDVLRGPASRVGMPPKYVVCPSLSARRILLLKMYGVRWLKMSAREFAHKVIPSSNELMSQGRQRIARRRNPSSRSTELSVGAKRTQAGSGSREYLRGNEPTWGDVVGGYAANLSAPQRLSALVSSANPGSAILVGGTAGCGRTTMLMQAALQMESEGSKVGWIESRRVDEISRISNLVDLVVEDGFDVVFVDDADGFGDLGHELVSNLQNAAKSNRIVVIGCRSVKGYLFDKVSNLKRADEFLLSNPDVSMLINHLRKHRVIPDRRMSDRRLEELLLVDSGRQLLVGMMQATSGKLFKDRIESECSSLERVALILYGGICVVSSQGEVITEEQALSSIAGEVLPALAWAAFNKLVQAKLVREAGRGLFFEAQHRVVAEAVVEYLRANKLLGSVLRGIVHAFAAAAGHVRDNSRPERRTLVRLLGHTFLIELRLPPGEIRSIYAGVEHLLDDDFNYWLQYGSFELERGDMDRALPALMSARTLAGGESDKKVLTTYARFRLKLAVGQRSAESSVLGMEAVRDLHKVVEIHGVTSPHTFVIICEYAVPWLVQADIARSEKFELASKTYDYLTNPIALRLDRDNREFRRKRPTAVSALMALLDELK